MKTKLTVIVDNIANNYIKGEWGLSILVEHGDKQILVDTGASELFGENMKLLGFDTEKVDYAILSHAHYDHANGMERFFNDNQKAKFYLRDGARENCYGRFWIFKRYIGIPKKILTNYSDRIEFVSGDYTLCEGVYLIPHKTPGLSGIGKREHMYQKTENGYIPDNFSHEQSLVLDTDKGLVIINSCSHGGAVNIIKEIMETFPGKKVYGLIGGFHLFNKSEDEVRTVAEEMKALGIGYVCTGHCTKDKAYQVLKEELGDVAEQFHVGFTKEF